MDVRRLLDQVKVRLRAAHGSRFQGVVLYGSEARGKATEDSDIDLLVLLRGPIDVGIDIRTNVDALYDLQLGLDRPLHAMPVNADTYRSGKCALYRDAHREGILA